MRKFTGSSGFRVLPLMLIFGLLAGCESFGRGVAKAVIEHSEDKDTRACHVEGTGIGWPGRPLAANRKTRGETGMCDRI